MRHQDSVEDLIEAYGRGGISAEELIEGVGELAPGFVEHLRLMLELEGVLAPLEQALAGAEREPAG